MDSIKSLSQSFLLLLLVACSSNPLSVVVLTVDNSPLVVCDETNVTETREAKLSELIDSLEIVRLDNRNEAYFKFRWLYFSEHYMCAGSEGKPIKLFDKSGRFIGNVGSVGNGPGEYAYVYDILINETQNRIYVASFSAKKILSYDLKGKFIGEISIYGEKLNKPRMFLNPDSTISIVHACFNDLKNKFVAANIPTQGTDSIKFVHVDALTSTLRNDKGEAVGYDGEIWSYRNVDNFAFKPTSKDTLYHYNSMKNEIKAHFTLDIDPERKGKGFLIFNELPLHYLVFIVGGKGGTILIDKSTLQSHYVNFTNDFMGNMSFTPRLQDGHFYDIYQSEVLKEKLEQHIDSGKCPEDQIKTIRNLISSLHEDDNYVVLLGKLKR